jgi:hypothetical protein
MPESVLESFHATHPTARLHVANCTRDRKPMNRLLLPSQQLHSLETNVYFEAADVCPHVDGRSEFQMLKKCLMRGNTIKVLHLGLEDVDKRRYW